jgi:hypothetical protein
MCRCAWSRWSASTLTTTPTRPSGATLGEGQKRWGALPPTYRSTSRGDGVSGIRLYRVPPGIKFSENRFDELGLGGGIGLTALAEAVRELDQELGTIRQRIC